jgi:hypothetical protein
VLWPLRINRSGCHKQILLCPSPHRTTITESLKLVRSLLHSIISLNNRLRKQASQEILNSRNGVYGKGPMRSLSAAASILPPGSSPQPNGDLNRSILPYSRYLGLPKAASNGRECDHRQARRRMFPWLCGSSSGEGDEISPKLFCVGKMPLSQVFFIDIDSSTIWTTVPSIMTMACGRFLFFIIIHIPYTLYSHFYFSFLKVAHHIRYFASTLTLLVPFL